MAEVKEEDLKKEIEVILKDADLKTTSTKMVRLQLEKTFGCNLKSWSQIISKLVMDHVNSMPDEESDQAVSESSDSESDKDNKDEKKIKEEADSDSESKPEVRKESRTRSSTAAAAKPVGVKKRAAGGGGGGGGGKKGTGFTRSLRLSPALGALVGGEAELPRHEVVRRVWALIKDRQLYDPRNKQFVLCDEQLFKVIGVKRFRAFGMMKYLKAHFIDD